MTGTARSLLNALYEAAVSAAHPATCLPQHLPPLTDGGRLIILAVGKAAAAMGLAAEAHYHSLGVLHRIEGLVTPPHGYAAALGEPLQRLYLLEARHPSPDAASQEAARRALDLAKSAGPQDLVLVLLSGGASSLWAAPAAGLDLSAKTTLTRGLLKCGADIHEMNAVRRHLSRIKGGRLRQAAARARILTLAISDVPGDDPQTIGSGPTVADPSTLADARGILARRAPRMEELGLPVPAGIAAALADPANETLKPDDPAVADSPYRIIATPQKSLEAAARLAEAGGYQIVNLQDRVTGEAREVAMQHAAIALAAKAGGRKVAIISGGELEVTVRNKAGRGGRSQEYVLALALALAEVPGIAAIAADTDGVDGGDGKVTDPAGALAFPDTLSRARLRHLDAQNFLDNNDATPFFEALGDLVGRGPTHTNVNDFRAVLVDP
jgi:glycerate 2-kinase